MSQSKVSVYMDMFLQMIIFNQYVGKEDDILNEIIDELINVNNTVGLNQDYNSVINFPDGKTVPIRFSKSNRNGSVIFVIKPENDERGTMITEITELTVMLEN